MKVSGFKMALGQGVLGLKIEIHKKVFKSFLLQNLLAQILEMWYVPLPKGPLPSLF